MNNASLDFIARLILFATIGVVLIGVRPLEVAAFSLGCAALGYVADRLYGSSRIAKKTTPRWLFQAKTRKDQLAWFIFVMSAPLAVLFVVALALSLFVGRETPWVWTAGAVCAAAAAWILLFLVPKRLR